MLHFAFLLSLVIQLPTVISIPKHLNENLKCIPCTVMTCVTWSSLHVQLQFPYYFNHPAFIINPSLKNSETSALNTLCSTSLPFPTLFKYLFTQQAAFLCFQCLYSLSLHLTNLSYNTKISCIFNLFFHVV